MPNAIAIDEYRYEEIYPSFKAGTDEKRLTADLNQRLLRRLLNDGIPASGRALKISDIGCGPCDTVLMYLDQLDYAPGFRIRATDFNAEYADAGGKAAHALATAQRERRLPLIDFAVRAGDAFSGNLMELLSAPGEREAAHSFDIVFASHMLYHAGGERQVRAVLDEVVTSLLAEPGIFILYHAAPDRGSLIDFRARYGRRSQSLEKSDTPAVNIGDPTACVSGYCAAQAVPYFEIKFVTNLFMPGLTSEHWRGFADPRSYAKLAETDPAACENLRRLMFVTQRAPLEFAQDRSSSGLDAYLREVRTVVERNGGRLELAERLQVLCRRDAPPRALSALRAAISELNGRERP